MTALLMYLIFTKYSAAVYILGPADSSVWDLAKDINTCSSVVSLTM
jgi:hypothetical protein